MQDQSRFKVNIGKPYESEEYIVPCTAGFSWKYLRLKKKYLRKLLVTKKFIGKSGNKF